MKKKQYKLISEKIYEKARKIAGEFEKDIEKRKELAKKIVILYFMKGTGIIK